MNLELANNQTKFKFRGNYNDCICRGRVVASGAEADLREQARVFEQRHAAHLGGGLERQDQQALDELLEVPEDLRPVARHVVPEREAHQQHQQRQADLNGDLSAARSSSTSRCRSASA